ncbi:MAG: mannosyltransferase family protein [Actinomycetota bacterium]
MVRARRSGQGAVHPGLDARGEGAAARRTRCPSWCPARSWRARRHERGGGARDARAAPTSPSPTSKACSRACGRSWACDRRLPAVRHRCGPAEPRDRLSLSAPGWAAHPISAGWHNLVTGLIREDALWFPRITTGGYRADDGSGVLPALPALTRALSFLTGGHLLLAALLVSNVAFFALLVLYRLTARTFSDAVARRTSSTPAIFPTAFFLAPYSESLFLLLSVSAFWFAREDRWWLAAVVGILAALTRSTGIMLAPALDHPGVRAGRRGWPAPGAARHAQPPLATRVVASCAVLLGPVLYLAWWQLAHGDPTAPLDAQANWGRVAAFPLTTLWRAATLALGFGHVGGGNGYWVIDALVVGATVAAVVADGALPSRTSRTRPSACSSRSPTPTRRGRCSRCLGSSP